MIVKIELIPSRSITPQEKDLIFNSKCPGEHGVPCGAPLLKEKIGKDTYRVSCHYGHSIYFFPIYYDNYKIRKTKFDMVVELLNNHKASTNATADL